METRNQKGEKYPTQTLLADHSLHVTGTSRLFAAIVPKKIAQHCLLEALRRYKHSSTEQDVIYNTY